MQTYKTHRIYFPQRLQQLWCSVEGRLGGYPNRTNLWVHFAHFHAQETIVIPEEGNRNYPRCPQYDMFVSHKALIGQNTMKEFCRWGAESNRRRMAEEEARKEAETSFTADGIPLA